MFLKIGVLKNFCNIHKKTPVLDLLFNKVTELEACNCIKKRLQHRCFLVNIAKFLRTSANGCFCTSNHKVSNKVLGICQPLLNQNLTWNGFY